MALRTDPREDGPLYRYTNRRPGYRRTVTMPERVGTHVKLVFAELARQQRTYDEGEAASGVRRPTIKQWTRKNAPSLDSLEAVLNSLGFHLVACLPMSKCSRRPLQQKLPKWRRSRRWSWARFGQPPYRSPRSACLNR
jgi:hypothetical protein